MKGLKLLFKLRREFGSLMPTAHTDLHVFDQTIKPILLYGCEIWGCSFPKTTKSDNLFDVSVISKTFSTEKIHTGIKHCKYILVVYRKSTNLAVLSELGRYPIQINVVLSLFKYWHHLNNSSFNLAITGYLCLFTKST